MNIEQAKIKAEQQIREEFEKNLADFLSAMTVANYGDNDLSSWDFDLEFSEWLTYR